jgi:hypothetical protein
MKLMPARGDAPGKGATSMATRNGRGQLPIWVWLALGIAAGLILMSVVLPAIGAAF